MPFSTRNIHFLTLPKFDFKAKRVKKIDYLLPHELEQLPGLIQQDSIIEFVTHGAWSSHNLLEKVIQKIGPANVFLTTWAITEKPLRVIHRLKNEGKIKKLGGLFDRKITKHNPKAYGFAKEVFDLILLSKCHAKVTIIENTNWSIAIVSTANYTVNRRTETGTIHCNKESVEFHKKWIFRNEQEEQTMV